MTKKRPAARPQTGGFDETVVQYGGGVNSVAMVLLLAEQGHRPALIVMSDPGAEWPETHAYREEVMNPWLVRAGLPTVTLVKRSVEVAFRSGGSMPDTLEEACLRTKTIPSAAFGFSGCSDKHKRIPALWYMERQAWAREVWATGRKIRKCIGYDTDEPRRLRSAFGEARENDRYYPSYPLFDAGMDREACEALILRHLPSLPRKSACMWCPNNLIADWVELRRRYPDVFARAKGMESNATIDSPDIVGFMRCNPHGKRQLALWSGDAADARDEPDQNCECGT